MRIIKKITSPKVYLIAALSTCGLPHMQAAAQEALRYVSYPTVGVELGQGWNSRAHAPVGALCIEVGNPIAGPLPPGQATAFTYSRVTNRGSLINSMGINFEAAYKSISYEVDARTSFATKTAINSSDINIAVVGKIDNGYTTVSIPNGGIRLKPEYATLQKSDPSLFRETCGDTYVYGVRTGATIDALITYSDVSTTEEREINAQFGVSGGGGSFKAKMDMVKTANNSQESAKILYLATGGNGNSLPTDAASLDALLGNLANSARNAPYKYEMAIQTYPLVQTSDNSDLGILAAAFWRYQDLQDTVTAINQNSDRFLMGRGYNGVQLSSDIGREIANINALIESCGKTPGEKKCNASIDNAAIYKYFARMPLRLSNPNAKVEKWMSNDALRNAIFSFYVLGTNRANCATALSPGKFGCETELSLNNYKNLITIQDGVTPFNFNNGLDVVVRGDQAILVNDYKTMFRYVLNGKSAPGTLPINGSDVTNASLDFAGGVAVVVTNNTLLYSTNGTDTYNGIGYGVGHAIEFFKQKVGLSARTLIISKGNDGTGVLMYEDTSANFRHVPGADGTIILRAIATGYSNGGDSTTVGMITSDYKIFKTTIKDDVFSPFIELKIPDNIGFSKSRIRDITVDEDGSVFVADNLGNLWGNIPNNLAWIQLSTNGNILKLSKSGDNFLTISN